MAIAMATAIFMTGHSPFYGSLSMFYEPVVGEAEVVIAEEPVIG
jgi:hypothetical protein